MHKEPLYRKVNTRARGVHHRHGGDFRDTRNAKGGRDPELTRQSMHGKQQRGLDYTPLFRFLLAKVGQPWEPVRREAVSRLDRPDPVFLLVAERESERREYVRTGESSYFSGLYVDDRGILRRVNPALDADGMFPSCACCTHTFNGKPFGNAYDSGRAM